MNFFNTKIWKILIMNQNTLILYALYWSIYELVANEINHNSEIILAKLFI